MRPTARDIVESVVQAMHDAHEPLDRGVVLVPTVYDVLIHPEAYRELEPILSRIKKQAKQRLEGEIERLNGSSGGFVGRLLRPLLRLFYPEHRLRRLMPGAQRIERSGDAWSVDVLVTADHAARIDFLAVETDFGGRISPVMRGDTGLHQRRRTTRLPEGGYETILITPAGGLRRVGGTRNGTTPPGKGSGSTASDSETAVGESNRPGRSAGRARPSESAGERDVGRPAPAGAVARLTYEDRQGKHTYYFEKREIVIGRHDEHGGALDVALHAPADVSREHVTIRRDGRSFEIKNLGRYGTRVNGKSLEPTGTWHPLPSRAEINFADTVIIRFQALDPADGSSPIEPS